MSRLSEKLYDLLPQVYRLRDQQMVGQDETGPLHDLMALIAQEIANLEENLDQLYDDQFIETCADWVVPYIGDLIGCRDLHTGPGQRSRRAEVANTIAYRRRKGTAAVIEQLARDVTGWDARVVEFFQLLIVSQYLNHIRPGCAFGPDLRDWESMEQVGMAFDAIPRSIDVRCITRSGGRYNIPNIGVFLWRQQAWPLSEVPAFRKDENPGESRYFFNPLGFDIRLVNYPIGEEDITHLAEPINTPIAISRRRLHEDLESTRPVLYGRCIIIARDGVDIPHADVAACYLGDHPDNPNDWAYKPKSKIAIDPELGRLAFPSGDIPSPGEKITVTYHYAFPAELGGGEYSRADTIESELEPVEKVPADHNTIAGALNELGGSGVVEIGDSGVHKCPLTITADGDKSLEVRAEDKKRPVLQLSSPLKISGVGEDTVTLSGLVFNGSSLKIPGGNNGLKKLRLVHCTLVPGLSLKESGEAVSPGTPSLRIESDTVLVEIERCVLGGIRSAPGCEIHITDSIIDAGSDAGTAFSASDKTKPGGTLRIENSTVVGHVLTRKLEYAANTIFTAKVTSGQTQSGCTRFSFVPYESKVPRQFQCQPSQSVRDAIAAAKQVNPALTSAAEEEIAKPIRNRIKPAFISRSYGTSSYLQLARSCPQEVVTGADDESEMGCYHMLYQPQREANLRLRLDEYVRVGLQTGIFMET